MTASIPASAIVNVYPSVIAAGGSGLNLVGLFLTRTARVPVGSVQAFTSATEVAAYFGGGAPEAIFAGDYFAGFDGSTQKPAKLLLGTYAATAVPAYLRGGRVSGLTLAALQSLAGVLTLSIDGRTVASSAINLSSAASFTAAAAIIQTALADADATFTGAIAGTVLTAGAPGRRRHCRWAGYQRHGGNARHAHYRARHGHRGRGHVHRRHGTDGELNGDDGGRDDGDV